MKIAIVGGTGKEGRGIAARWLRAGHRVAIGSRDVERARQRAQDLCEATGGDAIGSDNATAVADAQVVLIAVPFSAHRATVTELRKALADKITIDITVPLSPPHVRRVHVPEGLAAALQTQALTEGTARVVAALHHVSSVHLATDHAIDCDVLACSDDDEALQAVLALIGDLGLRGIHAGPLANAVALEALTPVLLHINKHYKNPGVGIRITGL